MIKQNIIPKITKNINAQIAIIGLDRAIKNMFLNLLLDEDEQIPIRRIRSGWIERKIVFNGVFLKIYDLDDRRFQKVQEWRLLLRSVKGIVL